MNIFDEFAEIIKHLEHEEIRYALVGGVAMAFYAEPRFTQDIDMILEPNDFEKARRILEQNGYVESATPWKFKSTPLTLRRFFKAIKNLISANLPQQAQHLQRFFIGDQ
nr:nucleotidyltransferase family protein [Desulfobulbaceae bacterium]